LALLIFLDTSINGGVSIFKRIPMNKLQHLPQ
jgi:hypothetical protein